MKTDDSTNYHTWDSSTVWNYGKEIWCNMAGRYLHIVADLSHLSGSSYSMTICSVGVMGTQYLRD